MKKFLHMVTLVFIVGFFSACASGPGFQEVNPSLVSDQPDMGRIFFYMPSSMGAAFQPEVLLNEEAVGRAKSLGYFYVDRPPGDYKVYARNDADRAVSFTLEKGKTRFIRLSVSMGFAGKVYGEVVEESVGLSEIQKCKTIVPKTEAK